MRITDSKVLLAFNPDRMGVERRRQLPDGIKNIIMALWTAGWRPLTALLRAEERPNKFNEQSVTRTSLRT
jgi:hypothetical protein